MSGNNNSERLEKLIGFDAAKSSNLTQDLFQEVLGDLKKERHTGYWVQDCSAAVENLLIEAQHLELGAVWLGIYPREDRVTGLKKLLNIPDDVIPLAVISIGFPAEKKSPSVERFDENRIHLEKW